MSSKDAHLYGSRPASRTKQKEISASSSVAFTSTLKHLIDSASSSQPGASRARSKKDKDKDDIFKTHNRNVKKRAAKDLEDLDATQQKHRGRTATEKEEDEAIYKRTKRIMERKALKYDALKRGEIEDLDDKFDVDFDRKWAEGREKGGPDAEDQDHDSSDSDGSDEELVEYTDEFGRTRKGTRAQAAREAMRKKYEADVAERFGTGAPDPENIIYGDVIQAEAYNPDADIARQMAELAAKRDKSVTPPPDEHFDGRKEARVRGRGYYQFSQDEEERAREMRELMEMRAETERMKAETEAKMKAKFEAVKAARQQRLDARKRFVAEQSKQIMGKRSQENADKFLETLGAQMFAH
ncbi:hypothetical protein BS50DRAFT_573518 [Corynespora cassiicola Philippines]|uniref:Uncharacterized protein n=1 Tax=Corynespora cassiicola Philippines TaxID=1448308 RepID=A0A2T2NMN9_CORCC|nr:hypothetical protein BS50DRAFT_573518 [Corynespora cassiicola Philippines]